MFLPNTDRFSIAIECSWWHVHIIRILLDSNELIVKVFGDLNREFPTFDEVHMSGNFVNIVHDIPFGEREFLADIVELFEYFIRLTFEH